MKAYLDAWRRCFDYSGVTSRRDFLIGFFFNYALCVFLGFFAALIIVLCGLCEVPLGDWYVPTVELIIRFLYSAFLIPLLAMTVRRLRDAGYSSKTFFWLPVPFIGIIAFLARLFGKTKTETNI